MTEARIIVSVEDANGEPQGVLAEGVGRGKSRLCDWIDAQTIERLRLQGREVRVIDPKVAYADRVAHERKEFRP